LSRWQVHPSIEQLHRQLDDGKAVQDSALPHHWLFVHVGPSSLLLLSQAWLVPHAARLCTVTLRKRSELGFDLAAIRRAPLGSLNRARRSDSVAAPVAGSAGALILGGAVALEGRDRS
jgi:hypothetical protein